MFTVYNNAKDLPNEWDEIATNNLFLRKNILINIERLNPCGQRYHINFHKEMILVTYKLKLDLLTFHNNLSLKLPVNIIGVPLSVSKNGYIVKNEENHSDFIKYLQTLKGLYIVLNTDDDLSLPKGNTLPTYKLPIRWDTPEEYMNSMRSSYRYRIKKAIRRFEKVSVRELQDNKLFDMEMYQLYLNVYNNSNEKLEKLSLDFFRQFPAKILCFELNNEKIGFIQLMNNSEELIFLFGGFKHEINIKYDIYINILLQIINYGIINRFKVIDLGQTAGETKSKVGAKQYRKNMYAHHSNQIINNILNILVDKFSYKYYNIKHSVFKEER